jgi:uncharacterized repeat protein (TIGR03809 family)
MTHRPAFSEFGNTAKRWRALAEKRRDYLVELHRSGRWRRFYQEDKLLARIRAVTEICERWADVVEEHYQVLSEIEALSDRRDAA